MSEEGATYACPKSNCGCEVKVTKSAPAEKPITTLSPAVVGIAFTAGGISAAARKIRLAEQIFSDSPNPPFVKQA